MIRTLITLSVVVGGYALAQVVPSEEPAVDHSAVPLYSLGEVQLDEHLRYLAGSEPDASVRLRKLAEQSCGQSYQPICLGEGAYDQHDPRPLYNLKASDSKSFVEQALAMSVADGFDKFFLVLQRIRYKNGQIATANRHYNLLSDWARHNSWLLEDVTKNLGGGMAWVPLHQVVRKKELLQERFGIDTDIPAEKFIDAFIPRVYLYKVYAELKEGDVLLVITGDDRQQYCEQIGIMAKDPQDEDRPLRMIMSHQPQVEKSGFRDTTIQRKDIRGFKFLRLRPDADTVVADETQNMTQQVTVPSFN